MTAALPTYDMGSSGVRAGTDEEFVTPSSVEEIEGALKAMEMPHPLAAAQEATARTARNRFPLVDRANNQPTADLLT